jgi:hypothetical protein
MEGKDYRIAKKMPYVLGCKSDFLMDIGFSQHRL